MGTIALQNHDITAGETFFLFRKIHGRITSVILILICVQIECELFIYFTTRGIDYYIFITNELLGCVLPGYGLNIKMSSWELLIYFSTDLNSDGETVI